MAAITRTEAPEVAPNAPRNCQNPAIAPFASVQAVRVRYSGVSSHGTGSGRGDARADARIVADRHWSCLSEDLVSRFARPATTSAGSAGEAFGRLIARREFATEAHGK